MDFNTNTDTGQHPTIIIIRKKCNRYPGSTVGGVSHTLSVLFPATLHGWHPHLISQTKEVDSERRKDNV